MILSVGRWTVHTAKHHLTLSYLTASLWFFHQCRLIRPICKCRHALWTIAFPEPVALFRPHCDRPFRHDRILVFCVNSLVLRAHSFLFRVQARVCPRITFENVCKMGKITNLLWYLVYLPAFKHNVRGCDVGELFDDVHTFVIDTIWSSKQNHQVSKNIVLNPFP